jgi:hypothetical protein
MLAVQCQKWKKNKNDFKVVKQKSSRALENNYYMPQLVLLLSVIKINLKDEV